MATLHNGYLAPVLKSSMEELAKAVCAIAETVLH